MEIQECELSVARIFWFKEGLEVTLRQCTSGFAHRNCWKLTEVVLNWWFGTCCTVDHSLYHSQYYNRNRTYSGQVAIQKLSDYGWVLSFLICSDCLYPSFLWVLSLWRWSIEMYLRLEYWKRSGRNRFLRGRSENLWRQTWLKLKHTQGNSIHRTQGSTGWYGATVM